MENTRPQSASPAIRIDGGRVGWLLLHDLAYGPKSLLPIAQKLRENTGDTMGLPYLPGPARPDASPADAWIRAARTEALRLYEPCQELYALGHGLGALLAMGLAQELPLSGVILLAPSLRDPRAWAPLAKIWSAFAPSLPHGDSGEGLEPSARKKAVPTASLLTVREIRARVLSGLTQVQAPTRLLCPEDDPWCPSRAAMVLAGRLPGCQRLLLPGSRHQCLTGESFQKILTQALSLRNISAGGRPRA